MLVLIFSFFLSLQFIHIYRIIDRSKPENKHFGYQIGDRPYGLRRFITKLLHYKTDFKGGADVRNIFSLKSPSFRLTILMFGFLCYPVLLYRLIIGDAEPLCSSNVCNYIYFIFSTPLAMFTFVAYYEIIYCLPRDDVDLSKCTNFSCKSSFFGTVEIIKKGTTNALVWVIEYEPPNRVSSFCFKLCMPFSILVVFLVFILSGAVVCIVSVLLLVFSVSFVTRRKNKCLKLVVGIVWLLTMVVFLRPMTSTIIFLLRSLTYFIMVSLLKPELANMFITCITIVLFFYRNLVEIFDLFQEILETVHLYVDPATIENEKLVSYVFHHFDYIQNYLYIFLCKNLLITLYIFVFLRILFDETDHNTASVIKDLISYILITALPILVSSIFKKSLSELQKKKIKELVDAYKKSLPANVDHDQTRTSIEHEMNAM